MVGSASLSPAEILVLLEPNASKGREALKVTLLHLLMQGLVRLRQESRKGFFGRTRTVSCLRLGAAREAPAPEAAPLVALVGAAEAKGGEIEAFVGEARGRFGADLEGFRRQHVVPALIRRGLVEERPERWLGLFHRTRLHHTPEGAAEKARLEGLMAQARTIPNLLAAQPAQALGIAAALGAAILLVPELRPLYQELSRHLQGPAAAGLLGDTDLSGLDWLASAPALDEAGLEDFGSLDALDASLDAFDSAFDSASDGGGGDGGGDGGGGGD